MNYQPFSVSICVYGGDNPEHFDIAMRSIITQTIRPSEIVLTIDGPIPNSIELIVSKYTDELNGTSIAFKKIRLDANMGHGEARRVCFQNCSYPIIALMDADDYSVPDRFEKQLKYLISHTNVSVVGSHITEFISNSNPLDFSNYAGKRIVPEKDKDIKAFMKKRCPMNQVTAMFYKKDVESVGGYIDWYCEEDYYLWIRLALAGKCFGNIPETLVYVRVGEEMYDRRGGKKYFCSELKLQKYMLDLNLISIIRFFINVSERFVLQLLVPNTVRGFIFQMLARD